LALDFHRASSHVAVFPLHPIFPCSLVSPFVSCGETSSVALHTPPPMAIPVLKMPGYYPHHPQRTAARATQDPLHLSHFSPVFPKTKKCSSSIQCCKGLLCLLIHTTIFFLTCNRAFFLCDPLVGSPSWELWSFFAFLIYFQCDPQNPLCSPPFAFPPAQDPAFWRFFTDHFDGLHLLQHFRSIRASLNPKGFLKHNLLLF